MSKPIRVAILIEDFFQDLEVGYPLLRLREEGFEVVTVEPNGRKDYRGKFGYPLVVDRSIEEVKAKDFDGVVIPGGWAPDQLRLSKKVLQFVRELFDQGKVVASICHGGWVLASSGISKGKTLTSYIAIKDDLRNAGANFVDREVVRDGNLITSRKPEDLPAFCREIIRALREQVSSQEPRGAREGVKDFDRRRRRGYPQSR